MTGFNQIDDTGYHAHNGNFKTAQSLRQALHSFY
jgi:hypothetical protein